MKLCLYDWNDAIVSVARQSAWIGSGSTNGKACRKSWTDSDAPGCQIALSNEDSCSGSKDIGRIYSGPYTIWTTGNNAAPNYLMSSGEASDCAGGRPTQFTLTGSEISGCSEPPKIILHDSPDKSRRSWVLDNTSMHNMTRVGIATYDSNSGEPWMYQLNDRVRAIELVSGKWEICEHIDYGGACLVLGAPGPTTQRLDTGWDGNWDQRISSIRPKACQ